MLTFGECKESSGGLSESRCKRGGIDLQRVLHALCPALCKKPVQEKHLDAITWQGSEPFGRSFPRLPVYPPESLHGPEPAHPLTPCRRGRKRCVRRDASTNPRDRHGLLALQGAAHRGRAERL